MIDRPPDILEPDPAFDHPVNQFFKSTPERDRRLLLDKMIAALIRGMVSVRGRAETSELLYALADQVAGLDALSAPQMSSRRSRYSFLWRNGKPWFIATMVLSAFLIVSSFLRLFW